LCEFNAFVGELEQESKLEIVSIMFRECLVNINDNGSESFKIINNLTESYKLCVFNEMMTKLTDAGKLKILAGGKSKSFVTKKRTIMRNIINFATLKVFINEKLELVFKKKN